MKRLLSLALILILLTVNAAAAELPKFADYSDDQLLLAYADLMQAMKDRGIYPYTDLASGDKGYEVIMLQTRLAELGYYTQKVTENYGNNTTNAMKAFQKASGLKQTGKASAADQQILFSRDAVEKGGTKNQRQTQRPRQPKPIQKKHPTPHQAPRWSGYQKPDPNIIKKAAAPT